MSGPIQAPKKFDFSRPDVWCRWIKRCKVAHVATRQPNERNTRASDQTRIQEFLKDGVDLVVVIYSILIFSFLIKLYEIIDLRLLEKRGLQPPELPSGSRPADLLCVYFYRTQ